MPGPARDYSSLYEEREDDEAEDKKKKKKKYSTEVLKKRLKEGQGSY